MFLFIALNSSRLFHHVCSVLDNKLSSDSRAWLISCHVWRQLRSTTGTDRRNIESIGEFERIRDKVFLLNPPLAWKTHFDRDVVDFILSNTTCLVWTLHINERWKPKIKTLYFSSIFHLVSGALFEPRFGPGKALPGHVISSQSVTDVIQCIKLCLETNQCQSINFNNQQKECEVSGSKSEMASIQERNGFHYYEVVSFQGISI